MEGVRLSKDELKAKFGIGERLAVRIVALLKKDVEVTPAVIEEAKRRAEVEDALLSAKLYEIADRLNARAWRSWFPQASGLTVVQDGGRAIIVLEEELELVDSRASKKSAPLARPALSAADLLRGGFRFSPAEIDQLKLTILTSVDSKAKVEAIRKLAYAEVDGREKGFIYLRALTDPDSAVRKEAVSALQLMGLNRELAECLAVISEGAIGQKRLALEKLQSLAPKIPEGEKHVALSTVIAALKYETDRDLIRQLILSLRCFGDVLAGNLESLAFLAKTLLKVLSEHINLVGPAVLEMFDAIAPAMDEDATDTLWREIAGIGDRKIKALFLGVLCRMKMAPALRRSMAEYIAGVLSKSYGEELEARRILDAGRALGEEQVKAFLDVLPQVSDDHLPFFLSSLDYVANSEHVSAETIRRVGQVYARCLESKGKLVRTAILEASLCHHPRMPQEIKLKLATDFIMNLHLYQMGRVAELISATLFRMGFAVIDALLAALEKSPYEVERVTALRLVGEICERQEGRKKELEAVVRTLKKLEKQKDYPQGPLAVCLARVLCNPSLGAAPAQEQFREYRGRLGRVNYNFDLILALGYLGASRNIEPREATEILLEMLNSLDGRLPDPLLSERRAGEGTRIYIGRESMAYTEFVPNVLRAIRMIYLSGKVPKRVREIAVARLVRRWQDLVEFREVWAPGNLLDLAEAMAEMARSPHSDLPMRVQILRALVQNVKNLTVARIASETFVFEDEDAEPYVQALGEYVRTLMGLLAHPDYQQQEDRRQIVAALGRVAGHRRLAPSRKDSEMLRDRIVELLIEHNVPNFREPRRLLERLQGSKNLPAALRKKIRAVVERTL